MQQPTLIDMPLEIIIIIIETVWYSCRRWRPDSDSPPNRPVYYNLLQINKEFNSRFKALDILIPMVAWNIARRRQFNRICLKMIMKQLNMDSILLPPNLSYNRKGNIKIKVSDIKEHCKVRVPSNPTKKEIRQNIYSSIQEQNIPYIGVIRVEGGNRRERRLAVELCHAGLFRDW